uniref:non-specific serine/threonine protein kinase n=1 Tax=Neurospora crassa TaxID=5141 RepID=Q873K1_NEUCS|nr:related to 3-phosphoinositide dependent protein kinase-1 (PDK1) [Neurospora crassa]
MNGDFSLSQALGGLRIANLDDDDSVHSTENDQTTPDAPANQSSASRQDATTNNAPQTTPPQPAQPAQPPSQRTPLDLERQVTPQDPPQRPPHTYETAAAILKNAQDNLSARGYPPTSQQLPAGNGNWPPNSRPTPGGALQSMEGDPQRGAYHPHGHGTAYGDLRNELRNEIQTDTSRTSLYGVPTISRSESRRAPPGAPTREPSRSYRQGRPGPGPPMGVDPNGALPPRRSSRGVQGGYSQIPGIPVAAPGTYTSEARLGEVPPMLSTSSEEWKDRGAAVGVRREVDADGRVTMKPVKKGVRDFTFGRILGEGSYSTVYLATDRQTLREYAVKVLEKKHIIKEKKIKYVNIEKNTLNRLTEHPGIVRLYYTFQDETSLYYVLDLCTGGELLGVLKKTGTFDVECTRFYGAQILDAIDYMHSRGIIHRDLKPENVLLDEQMHVKITDFGTAKLLRDPRDPRPPEETPGQSGEDDERAASFVGTAEYVSPELLTEKSASTASDIWAFGCIIYQLLAGRPPFKAGTEYLTFQKIVKLEYEFPPGFPSAARDLVERCLVLDPAQRFTVEHIKKHEFFAGQMFGKELWRMKAPRLRPYVPGSQEQQPQMMHLGGGGSNSNHSHHSMPMGNPSSTRGNTTTQGGPANNNVNRPARIITELPPPTQLDLDWSPVLTKNNERILKLGDLMVVSSPIPHSPHGKEGGEGHKKLARFFGGSTTKKRQRLVMITSSGRIVFAPAGGEEKKAKQEISLLASDCTWKAQIDAKGQPVWTPQIQGGVHYTFEEPKSSEKQHKDKSDKSSDGGAGRDGANNSSSSKSTVDEWIESLERAKDLALSQNLVGSNDNFGDMSMSSSPAGSMVNIGGGGGHHHNGRGHGNFSGGEGGYSISDRSGRNQLTKSQASLDDSSSVTKRNRFSRRQSKNGLGAAF